MKTVLFVCVHNAGRSQMAAGFMQALGAGKVQVLSAGSAPKDSINPVAVQAMAEARTTRRQAARRMCSFGPRWIAGNRSSNRVC